MYQKLDPEKVLVVVKRLGPCVPNEVRKELGLSDSIIVGATLSELLRAGRIATTTVRKGSSSLYYDPNNPFSLEKASQYLNEKDVRTYNLLKKNKVLSDNNVDPLTRVGLRNIKDFSKKLTINYKNQELVFWRYFLVSQEEAVSIIKDRLGILKKKIDKKEEIKSEVVQEKVVEKPKEIVKEVTKEKIVKPREEIQKKLSEKEKENEEEVIEKNNLKEISDEFYKKIKNYFDKNNIKVVEQKLIRKNSEIDFIILLPSPLGEVKYFCKAKSKKKSNDGDLASAKMQGLSQNLPTAYLTTGEVTKKAKAMLDNELKGIVVKEL